MTGERQPPAFRGDLDPPEAQILRAELVRRVAQYPPWPASESWDPRVLRAIGDVPRHLFVPQAPLADAYADEPYPIGRDQTISQPTVVALMTQALLLLRRIASLGQAAAERLAMLGHTNVTVRIGDGYEGWPSEAPFDRIVVTAAPLGVPDTLLDQLADGGVCVAPVGDRWGQTLVRWRREGDRLDAESLGAVRFVPMLPGTT